MALSCTTRPPAPGPRPANMIRVRNGPATLLPDGRGARVVRRRPVYDPASGTWTATGKRNTSVALVAAATLLSDGKVLVAGGYVDNAGMTRYGRGRGLRPRHGVLDRDREHAGAARVVTDAAPGLRTQLPDGKVLVYSRTRIRRSMTRPPEPGPHFLCRPVADDPRALLSDGTVLMTGIANVTAGRPRVRPADRVVDDRLEHARDAAPAPRSRSCSTARSSWRVAAMSVPVRRQLYVPAGVALPPLPAFPSPLRRSSRARPRPRPGPTPLPPAAGPVPPNARSWTVTVDNESSEPATLFVGDLGDGGIDTLVGSATPNVVPAGATVKVTFLFPAK